MSRLIAIGALVLASSGAWGADSHFEAARQFYEVSKVEDPKGVSQLVTRMVAELQPGLRQHEVALARFVEDVLGSEDYIAAQVQTYRELFTESELRALTRLFQDETFRKYRQRRIELARRGAQNTMALFQERLPELEAQLARDEQTRGGTN